MELQEPIPPLSEAEVREAMRRMSRGKAADQSGIVLEMFLYGGDALIEYLTYFFNLIIASGDIPANWRESLLVLLHKGGARNDANNWRPIAY